MSFRAMLLCLGSSILCIFAAAAADDSESVTLTLPAGDAEAGRAAFVSLSCISCHRVQGETGFPDPVSATPGPTLGRYHAQRTPAQLATSIYTPSHEISAFLRNPREDGASPMSDFTNTMTIRQFLDIIAYLRSLPVTGESKPVPGAGR